MHELIDAGPLTVQVTPPVGAGAPVVPVTVTVNERVELSAPLPAFVPVRTMVGVALGTTTSTADTGETDK